MKLSNKKLLIINLPPPYGGGEMLNQLLLEHFGNKSDYQVIDIGKSKQKKKQQGRVNLPNILYAFYSSVKVTYHIARYKPSLIYFLIPKSFGAFVKTVPIILLCDYFGIYSIGSLEGNGFYFLDSKSNFKQKTGASLLNKIKKIRVLGEGIARNLTKYNINNTVIVPNGVNIPSYLIKKREIENCSGTIRFLYVGVLSEFKGISFLINSFIKLLSIRKDIELHLIGEWYSKDLQKKLLSKIEKCNLSDHFFFYGIQHNEKKWELFEQMNIYIHLSKLDGQPLSILEAMGCGMPIISTKVGAIPETVIDNYNGILLDNYDSTKIIEIIQLYVENRALIVAHSENSVKRFNEIYTSSKFLERMENLFNENVLE